MIRNIFLRIVLPLGYYYYCCCSSEEQKGNRMGWKAAYGVVFVEGEKVDGAASALGDVQGVSGLGGVEYE